MKSQRPQTIVLCLLLIVSIAGLSGCSSTRSENGVTVQENRGMNPLNYIPGL